MLLLKIFLLWLLKNLVIRFEPTSCPRKDFERVFEPIHPSFKGYKQEGIVIGEEIISWADWAHIMWPQLAITGATGNVIPIPQWVYGSPNTVNGLAMLNLFFLFYRGGQRVKIIDKDPSTPKCMFLTDGSGVYTPTCDMISTGVPVAEFQIPYYTQLAYQRIRGGIATDQAKFLLNASATSVFYLVGAADDYSCHYVFPMPPGTFSNNSTTIGFKGLRAYFG